MSDKRDKADGRTGKKVTFQDSSAKRSKRLESVRKDSISERHRVKNELEERNKRLKDQEEEYKKNLETIHAVSEKINNIVASLDVVDGDDFMEEDDDEQYVSSASRRETRKGAMYKMDAVDLLDMKKALRRCMKCLLKMHSDVVEVRKIGTKTESQIESELNDFRRIVTRVAEIKRNETSGCDPSQDGNWLLNKDFSKQ